MKNLKGKIALVTGGTRGIGRAIAERLREDGAKVIVTGTGSGGKPPRGCDFRAVNLDDQDAAEALAEVVALSRIDILVNNAGINRIAPFEKVTKADFDAIWRVNTRSAFLLCQAALGGMKHRRWGRIINISSVFGVVSKEQRAAYSASKWALEGMTAALAAEAAKDNVLANCVAPGFIDTDLTRRVLGLKGMKALAKQIPAGRLGKPAEIAALVAWLAGPENSYVTGQTFVIDGGFTMV